MISYLVLWIIHVIFICMVIILQMCPFKVLERGHVLHTTNIFASNSNIDIDCIRCHTTNFHIFAVMGNANVNVYGCNQCYEPE